MLLAVDLFAPFAAQAGQFVTWSNAFEGLVILAAAVIGAVKSVRDSRERKKPMHPRAAALVDEMKTLPPDEACARAVETAGLLVGEMEEMSRNVAAASALARSDFAEREKRLLRRIGDLEHDVATLRGQRDDYAGRELAYEARIADLEARIAGDSSEIEQLKQQLFEVRRERDDLAARVSALEAAVPEVSHAD